MDRRVFLAGSLAAAALPLVRASDFPSRPVRVISPYAAGGGLMCSCARPARCWGRSWGSPS